MFFKQIFDKKLAQYAYLIGCQATGEAIVIDPMRDVDQYHKLAKSEGLEITAAADTHIHADYVSGLRELAAQGVKVYASDEGDEDWKYEWLLDSDYNYQLVTDGDSFSLGNIKFDVVHTPGHTPGGMCLYSPPHLFSGDTLFVGGVGRTDFPGGDTGQLLNSIQQRLFVLPPETVVWPGHGYGGSRSTIADEKETNPYLTGL